MQTLATELRVQGRILKQIKRQGRIALYELHHPESGIIGFEVSIIQIRPAEELFGKSYPDREAYPTSADWGTSGFSYQTLDKAGAEKRFASLLSGWPANGPAKAESGGLIGSAIEPAETAQDSLRA